MWRFSSYDVMVICPTWYHLGIYECVLDFAGGGRGNEDTHEYHYCDVVAVATRTRSRTGPGFELVDDASNHVSLMRTMTQDLEIVASSGDRSAIVVGIHDDAARTTRSPCRSRGSSGSSPPSGGCCGRRRVA